MIIMDMLGVGSASFVHAGLGAASAGLTELGGLEGLVNNGVGGGASVGAEHHHHHQLHHHHHAQMHHAHHVAQQAHHHAALSSHHHMQSHPQHHMTSTAQGHSVGGHPHSVLHHPSNQPLPPHRPFTPPGSLSSHQLTSTSLDSGSANGPSYSPNSTTAHLPSSTVKIKSGKKREN